MAPPETSQNDRSEDVSPTTVRGSQLLGPENETANSSNRNDLQSSQDLTQSRLRPSGTSLATTYGTISSSDLPSLSRTEEDTQERPSTTRVASSANPRAADNSRTPASPNLSAKQGRPSTLRRASTKRPGPYRGQEFSVDDDPTEYETDQQETSTSTRGPRSTGTLRRKTSTLRRRGTGHQTILPRVDSMDEEDDITPTEQPTKPREEEEQLEEGDSPPEDGEEADDDLSDAESFTLRDRQLAINQTHPFGIRIWKPALYKKNRSVEKGAEEDIHASPRAQVSNWLAIFNIFWTIFFGWWMAIFTLLGACVCFLCSVDPSAYEYGKVLASVAWYLFYPFGTFVRLETDENYAEEDEGEGRSISEYERWQNGDLEYGRLFFGPSDRSIIGRRRNSVDSASERDSLLGRTSRSNPRSETDLTGARRRRLFGRGQWTLGRVVFFISFYVLVAPFMLFVSGVCWFMVFWIPMGRVMLILFSHLRRHPLALTFHSDASFSRPSDAPSTILVCTYRAVGMKYWKYTVDGTNIFLINLLAVVLFTIVDYFVLDEALGIDNFLTHPGLIFPLALFSVIPLAYFIGQAVASISAQSSMGVGAVVNAFFSTVVEVFLYCVALNDGKGQLVEGSIIGSIFAGILLLPGLSMCFGAISRKTQRFNVRSAGVTTTMLLFAVVGAFGPTLFYQIYGSHELKCKSCIIEDDPQDRDCRRCFFSQIPAVSDRFFIEAVRPYCWISAVLLFLSYMIGLWFTLRTHAAVIWSTEIDEKKAPTTNTADHSPAEYRHTASANGQPMLSGSISSSFNPKGQVRDSQLYKRILGQSLKQVGLTAEGTDREYMSAAEQSQDEGAGQNVSHVPHVVPPRVDVPERGASPPHSSMIPGLSEEDNQHLVREVAEIAATAAAVAARDAVRLPRRTSHQSSLKSHHKPSTNRQHTMTEEPSDMATITVEPAGAAEATGGGHDAPNWSKTKSIVILLIATIAYAVIAEILVATVDVVLQNATIDQKFLGLTLFALVPNTTEFLNGISFAMNGNIALSMEIGSAYALQVCLLQIPALVLFSAVKGSSFDPEEIASHTFNLIFPQWDMVLVILSVLLLSNLLSEGKSNYFKGSILVLTYLVTMLGFWFSGYDDSLTMGVNRYDTLAMGQSESFLTRGRTSSGRAY